MKKTTKKAATAATRASGKAKAKSRRVVGRTRVASPSSRRETAEPAFRAIFAANEKTARKNLERYAPHV